ncbi:MAG: hypothetical protein Q9180_008455 [Flavoplaca navasiana]
MLGLSTYATDAEVREACEEFASLAGAVSGARESLAKQRMVAEVCAVVGFPRDPYLSTKFHEEALLKAAESTILKHPTPTKEELAAWETLVPSGDHGSEHDEASGKASLSIKNNLTSESGRSDDVEEKAPPNDREVDPIPAIIQRSIGRRNSSAFRQWRQQRARASL